MVPVFVYILVQFMALSRMAHLICTCGLEIDYLWKTNYKSVALTSAVMSLNFVMKACLTTSTAISDKITMKTSGSRTQRWSASNIKTINRLTKHFWNSRLSKYHSHYESAWICLIKMPRNQNLHSGTTIN